jgi:hypothetical protein
MKINLRKSAALQGEISNAIVNLQMSSTVRIDKFEPSWKAAVEKPKTKFLADIDTAKRLSIVLYSIRQKTQRASVTAGIGDILNEIQKNSKLMALEGAMTTATPMLSDTAIEARVADLSVPPVNQYQSKPDGFNICVITEAESNLAADNIAGYRKANRDLQDKLLTLNVNTEIELDAEAEKLLKELKLI